MNLLIAIYRAWPLRPHCAPPRHVALCRLLLGSDTKERCWWRQRDHPA